MTAAKISGIVPVLPTPFLPDESLDLESLRKLVRFCAEKRFSAVCLPAYASEFYKLTMAERYEVVRVAVDAANGETQVIAQSNHYSGMRAAEIAARNEQLGADVISVAVPRMFDITEDDARRFVSQVIQATSLPVLVQDFNPGGPTMSAETARRLNTEHPQFRYLKLEQPLMAPRVAEILEATGGAVQILEGWGGLYLLEGNAAGICGAMPALGVADILQEAYDLAASGETDQATDRFQEILPYLVFSLQNMELLLHMEKKLLVRRSLLAHDTVRNATLTCDRHTERHADFLIGRALQAIRKRQS